MATGQSQRGRAKDAPMSVPLTNDPDSKHHRDLTEYLRGRRDVVVKAKVGTGLYGWGPGDDTSESAGALSVPPGGVARAVIESGPTANQDPTLLASLIARGRLDIVKDAEMAKAGEHKEIWREHRRRDLELQGKRSGDAASLEAQIAVLRAQVKELQDAKAA